MGKNVTISLELYDQLIDDQKKLYALYAGGVDNWGGYDDALESAGLFDDYDEDEEDDD